MNDKEVYLASAMLALAFMGLAIAGVTVQPVAAVSASHTFKVWLDDAWTGWNWFGSYIGITTSVEGANWQLTWYNSAPSKHTVWPCMIFNTPTTTEDTLGYCNFVRVSCYYDYGTGIPTPWGAVIIETKSSTLYTDVYLQGTTGNTFVFSDWWTQ